MYGVIAVPWCLVCGYFVLNTAVFIVSGTWWFPGEGF